MEILREGLGFISCFLFVLATTQKNELNLRLVNTVGCILSVAYGIWLGAYSIWVMNTLMTIINLYKINKLRKR